MSPQACPSPAVRGAGRSVSLLWTAGWKRPKPSPLLWHSSRGEPQHSFTWVGSVIFFLLYLHLLLLSSTSDCILISLSYSSCQIQHKHSFRAGGFPRVKFSLGRKSASPRCTPEQVKDLEEMKLYSGGSGLGKGRIDRGHNVYYTLLLSAVLSAQGIGLASVVQHFHVNLQDKSG